MCRCQPGWHGHVLVAMDPEIAIEASAQTLAGTTNGARYSRVSMASASESFTNDSVEGLMCSLRPSR